MPFLSDLVRTTERAINDVTGHVDRAVNANWTSHMLEQLQTGTIVQFASRSSKHTLQIVQSPDGRLVVDGLGAPGANAYNTHWQITQFGKNNITLSNQNNYLSIVGGHTVILQFNDPTQASADSHFRAIDHAGHVCLQSITHPNCYVGVLRNGLLKPASQTIRDFDGQWQLIVMFKPTVAYNPAPPPKNATPLPPRY